MNINHLELLRFKLDLDIDTLFTEEKKINIILLMMFIYT